MNDISDTIEGFYTLLKETRGIVKRELRYAELIFGEQGTEDLFDYISDHLLDAVPEAEKSGRFSVQVPLDRSKFYGGFWAKFSMNKDTGRVINYGIDVSLIDEEGIIFSVSDESLENQRMRSVLVSADTHIFI